MVKINPFDSWLPLQARVEREPNPRIRSLILAVRDHMEHEIRGDMTKLMMQQQGGGGASPEMQAAIQAITE